MSQATEPIQPAGALPTPARPGVDVEQILEAILRGAAKILGCSSANLIVFNQERGEVRIRVGTSAERVGALNQVESLFGNPLQSMVFALEQVVDSMVAAAWRDRCCLETDSLAELVGTAFPRGPVAQVAEMLGPLRFICVPVTCGTRIYGVMIFTKEEPQPFGPQRREILLRYAQRIGEIIDNDLRSRGSFVSRPAGDAVQRQLLHLALGETAPAILVDPGLAITSHNPATSRLFGYPADELLGRPIDLLFRDQKDVRTILNQQFLFLSDGYAEDVAVVRDRAGRFFPGKVRALLLADGQDRVLGFLVVIQDQSALPESAGPGEAVERLMRRERLATMGELAAQLAHEIRNPLISIGASLEMLSHRPDASAEIAALAGELAGEVTRIDLLLRDYLTLAARRGARVAPVDVGQLLADASRLVSRGQGPQGVRLATEAEPGLGLMGDYEGLRHVLLNLLRNAVEASPPGAAIRCRARGDEREVCIEIEDRGCGLSSSPDECVEPFFTTKANGTGMGLTVCQRILQAHGGTISLGNRAGGGCRARVLLPRKARP